MPRPLLATFGKRGLTQIDAMMNLIEWAFAYFTWQRRSRVILEVPKEASAVASTSVVSQMLKTGS